MYETVPHRILNSPHLEEAHFLQNNLPNLSSHQTPRLTDGVDRLSVNNQKLVFIKRFVSEGDHM
jgi:hypothetical protein